MQNENEVVDNATVSVEVAQVMEKFIETLIGFEGRLKTLEVAVSLLHEGYRMLGEVGKQHEVKIAAVTAEKPPELPGQKPPDSVN